MKYIYYILFLCAFWKLDSIVYIFTTAYNRPEFIEFQYKTFKKFLKDEYEFFVFNDASDENIKKEIETTCKKLNIKCLNIPQEIHSYIHPLVGHSNFNGEIATFRHGDAVKYAFEKIGYNHNDITILIDSDVFLIRDFSVREYLKNYDISGYKKNVYPNFESFLVAGLIFLDMKKLPNKRSINFTAEKINGILLDCCAQLQFYFKKYPKVKIKEIKDRTYIKYLNYQRYDQLVDSGFSNEISKFIEKYIDTIGQDNLGLDDLNFFDKTFLDFNHGSNWLKGALNDNLLNTKFLLVKEFIDSITSN